MQNVEVGKDSLPEQKNPGSIKSPGFTNKGGDLFCQLILFEIINFFGTIARTQGSKN